MHWRTDHRLRAAEARATKAYLVHAVAVVDRLAERVGRATLR